MKKNVLHLAFGAALLFAGCSGNAPSYHMSDIVVSGDTPMTKEMAEVRAYENELVEAALCFTACVYETDFANQQQADSVLNVFLDKYKEKYRVYKQKNRDGKVLWDYAIYSKKYGFVIRLGYNLNEYFDVTFGYGDKILANETFYRKRAACKFFDKVMEYGYCSDYYRQPYRDVAPYREWRWLVERPTQYVLYGKRAK